MLHPRNPPNPETQIPRYKFTGKWDQNLNLNLYHAMPRKLSFSIRWISGMQEHFQWKLSYVNIRKQWRHRAKTLLSSWGHVYHDSENLKSSRSYLTWNSRHLMYVNKTWFPNDTWEKKTTFRGAIQKRQHFVGPYILLLSDSEKLKSSRSCVTWNLRHLTYVNMTPNDTWEKERPVRGAIHMPRRNCKRIPMYVNMIPPTIFEEQSEHFVGPYIFWLGEIEVILLLFEITHVNITPKTRDLLWHHCQKRWKQLFFRQCFHVC